MKTRLIILFIFITVFTLIFVIYKPKPTTPNNNQPIINNQNLNLNYNDVIQNANLNRGLNNNANNTNSTALNPTLFPPISDYQNRVTKKPFGIYITPQNSPVQPEKFSGYHTGTDFEILPGEENIDVPIYSFCDGKILEKKYTSGYGGVLVESCSIDNQPVTIIYGHLKLSAINKNAGDDLTKGEKIGILGTGYSPETDGERKHLHFGIHKSASVSILGYVQKKEDLNNWLDPLKLL